MCVKTVKWTTHVRGGTAGSDVSHIGGVLTSS